MTSPFVNSPMSVELLTNTLHCITSFCEENIGCLEGMLRNGTRVKIVQILAKEEFFHLSVLRSGLGCLAVLCGYTHNFTNNNQSNISIPTALQLSEQELFNILSMISNLLNRFILTSSAVADIDSTAVMNFGLVCRYLLPLCSPSDPIHKVYYYYYFSLIIIHFIIITINVFRVFFQI